MRNDQQKDKVKDKDMESECSQIFLGHLSSLEVESDHYEACFDDSEAL